MAESAVAESAVAEPASTPAPAGEPTAVPTPTPALPVGWWRSDSLCLELFEHGDFELSIMGRGGPKAMVMGAARTSDAQTPSSTQTVELDVRRIWHARYTGPCRKIHELGGFVEEESALGLRFEPGTSATVTLTRIGKDELKLCGEDCQTLRRETPILGARWRKAGFEHPSNPTVSVEVGDLLEFDLDDSSAHVWAALGGEDIATVYGTATTKFTGPDRFSITFEPNGVTDQGKDAAISLWGAELRAGRSAKFSAHRLPEQRIEICDAAKHCVTLERQFDAYHHDLH